MNRYPLWKHLLVLIVVLVGAFFALPNVFDQDPALEISGSRRAEVNETTAGAVSKALEGAKVNVKAVEGPALGKILVRYPDSESQLRGKEVLEEALGPDYTFALTLSTDLPEWIRSLGALPMYLGLDLRGGLPFVGVMGIALALVGCQMGVSVWWLGRFRQGPLEWLWRTLTYGKAVPMKRSTAPPAG